jgi:hypothetical protein
VEKIMRVRLSQCCPLAAIVVAVAVSQLCQTAHAALVEVANLHLLNATQPLSFANNGGVSATLTAVNVPVVFNYTTQSGLSTADRSATLTINPTGTAPTTTPDTPAGSLHDQPINPLRFSIIENGTGKNLLSMSPTRGDITGVNNTVNASLAGTTTGVFSSDFLGFLPAANESFNFGLATINPALTTGPGGFLNSFIANINAQFSVDDASFISPEPSALALLALAALASPRRPRRP